MKRVVMLCVCLMALSFTAMADPAVIIRDFGCGLFDGNGGGVFTTNTFAVVTDSETGATLLRCQADVTPSSSGKAVQYGTNFTGGLCGTFAGLTSQWHEVVSANGKATLSCHLPD